MDAVKLASSASLNDCMMRNIYRYRYVVVVDFDEIIIPRSHHNYSQLVQHINLKAHPHDQPHTYTFHNTYFFLDLPRDEQQPEHMRTASFRQRVPSFARKASVFIADHIVTTILVYLLCTYVYIINHIRCPGSNLRGGGNWAVAQGPPQLRGLHKIQIYIFYKIQK